MSKRYNLRTIKITYVATILLITFSQVSATDLVTAGWIEKAVIFPAQITLLAKLDTGAATTSINAIQPEFFERNGSEWVRFDITNKESTTAVIEAPVIRTATIKRHFGNKQTRPVIKIDICIGNVRKIEEVNLVNRSNLNYQLLVGRNFLKNNLLIDSAKTYRLSPDCSE